MNTILEPSKGNNLYLLNGSHKLDDLIHLISGSSDNVNDSTLSDSI